MLPKLTVLNTTTEEMLVIVNLVKQQVLDGLEKECLLKGSAAQIGEQYAVIIHKRGWLGRCMEKFFGDRAPDTMNVSFVKVIRP